MSAPVSPPEVEPTPESAQTPEGAQNGSQGAREAHTPEVVTAATLREALPDLRRPFAANAVRWKVQTMFGGKRDPKGKLTRKPDGSLEEPPHSAQIVAYIDARTVIDRLNLVVADLWYDEYDLLSQGLLRCRLTINDVTRSDVGEGTTKGLYSDALKRAAVKFGVGVSLYTIPRVVLRSGTGANKLKVTRSGLVLTDQNLQKLREGYDRWLSEHGEQHFGRALDHGDVADAMGDPDAPDEAEAAPEGVDPETGEVNEGRKITKAEVDDIARLVEEAPPWVASQEMHHWLDELGVGTDSDDLVTRVKLLRGPAITAFRARIVDAPAEIEAPDVA